MADSKSLTISGALFNCIKEDRKKLYIHLCSTIIENENGVLNLSNKFLDTQYLCISLRLYSVRNKDGRFFSFYFFLSLLLSFSLSLHLSFSLSLFSIFLSGVSNGCFRPCFSIIFVIFDI